ncbi:MAG: DMT family transporter [Pseudomonadota bacterium]
MLWLYLSLATAFLVATSDTLTKKFFSHLSPHEMAVSISVYSLPFTIITFPFVSIPPLDFNFWKIFITIMPFEVAAFLLYMKAIKLSPLSLSIPFLAFTPVFMIVTGFSILGEMPSMGGIGGVVLILAGGYVIQADKISDGYLGPFRAIVKEPGSRLMLLISFLYASLAVLGKKAILLSSPLFFGLFYLAITNCAIIVICPLLTKIRWDNILCKPRLWQGLLVGLLQLLQCVCHVSAVVMVEAIYMVAVKRISILITVIYGWAILKEVKITQRLAGSFLMFIGVVCIVLLK